jgi:hypothetical protein
MLTARIFLASWVLAMVRSYGNILGVVRTNCSKATVKY